MLVSSTDSDSESSQNPMELNLNEYNSRGFVRNDVHVPREIQGKYGMTLGGGRKLTLMRPSLPMLTAGAGGDDPYHDPHHDSRECGRRSDRGHVSAPLGRGHGGLNKVRDLPAS